MSSKFQPAKAPEFASTETIDPNFKRSDLEVVQVETPTVSGPSPASSCSAMPPPPSPEKEKALNDEEKKKMERLAKAKQKQLELSEKLKRKRSEEIKVLPDLPPPPKIDEEAESLNFENWLCEDNTEFWDNMSQMVEERNNPKRPRTKTPRRGLNFSATGEPGGQLATRSSPRLKKS